MSSPFITNSNHAKMTRGQSRPCGRKSMGSIATALLMHDTVRSSVDNNDDQPRQFRRGPPPHTRRSRNNANLSDMERVFLAAAEQSDLASIQVLLDRADELGLDINCTDWLGRSALRIAIENEHMELLELLITSAGRRLQLSEGLLHAVNCDNVLAVEMLLQARKERWGKKNISGFLGQSHSASFTPDITPLILAAHRDNYAIVKLLVDAGDRIDKPHDLRCACASCRHSRRLDCLQHSKRRLNAYRALSSPSWIVLTSSDPIRTAFEMNAELKKMGRLENAFQIEYQEMADNCEEFATALLAETRNSDELMTVLNHDDGDQVKSELDLQQGHCDDEVEVTLDTNSSTSSTNWLNRWSSTLTPVEPMNQVKPLTRLKMAISYDQKKFVAHPHCQQLLASIWYEGLPGFRQKPLIAQLGTILVFCILFPLLSMAYMLCPNSKLGVMMKRPFIKFICHSSAYLAFLGILALAATRIEFVVKGTLDQRMNERDPLPSLSEVAASIFVIGFIWQDIKRLYSMGLTVYLKNMWNILDFVMNSLYVATITMRAVAWIRIHVYHEQATVKRQIWDAYDPILISECMFAAANILSALRLVQLFTVSPQLGPLQISLGRMLNDIFKFFILYLLVIVAFAFGLNQLFWFYAKRRERNCALVSFTLEEEQKAVYDYCITRGTYFTNLFEIVQSLYWSTYGLIELTSFNLEFKHAFTEFVGKLTFGVYSYIAFIVLLNMLIAMMNNSYEQIVQQVDVEWKFARSKLWISYFGEGCTVPVPFNVIPTPKSIYYLCQWLRKRLPCCNAEERQRNYWHFVKNQIKILRRREARYLEVMQELTGRYTMRKLASSVKEPVTTDHLNEIKGDVSAFRHELIDILKSNGMLIPEVHRKSPTIDRDASSGNRRPESEQNGDLTINVTAKEDENVPGDIHHRVIPRIDIQEEEEEEEAINANMDTNPVNMPCLGGSHDLNDPNSIHPRADRKPWYFTVQNKTKETLLPNKYSPTKELDEVERNLSQNEQGRWISTAPNSERSSTSELEQVIDSRDSTSSRQEEIQNDGGGDDNIENQ